MPIGTPRAWCFEKMTREFTVEVELVVEMAVHNPFDFFLDPSAENFRSSTTPALEHELDLFQRKCWNAQVRRNISGRSGRPARGRHRQRDIAGAKAEVKELRTNDFLVALNQRLWKDIKYTIRLEPGVQTPEETLEKRAGPVATPPGCSCQLLRHFGLAARFVSGYLDPAQSRRKVARWPQRPGKRLHRPARLD